ncbi:lipid A biosynthesis lauroyl acyltransferase [Rickettsia canadensis str. McKiel]|uniref:Lipid A biosynthesis lauroyl acyltransferase n=1 Tax=Rickettsia canadensis (strain McKiel) TaxID=293613 RepID=A8EZT0_RICCK|nr:lipid A biosynthesis lauroyl acyltransferase [Rickettsia canadensis]ABV73863.1 lipid A biosynthesis lauroyl acyltransferase [Rickettsia canadensis str. McKiel]
MKKFLKKLRYLIEYFIIVIFLKVIGMLGMDKAADICSFIARKIGILFAVNKIARSNIKAVFGDMCDVEKIIDQTWGNFGRFIGEFAYVNKMNEVELKRRIEIIGIENIKKLEGQPFLLFSGHFANWDIALKRLYKSYPKFAVIYRKANNPYVNKLVNESRASDKLRLIPKGPEGSRALFRAIKEGESIVMLVDQKMNNGIEVPFLGYPAMTANAIAKIALQYKYPIIPCQIIRTKGSYFKLILHSQLMFEQSGDNKVDCYNIMLNINQILGEWVKQNPSQWFWFHNRWKKYTR